VHDGIPNVVMVLSESEMSFELNAVNGVIARLGTSSVPADSMECHYLNISLYTHLPLFGPHSRSFVTIINRVSRLLLSTLGNNFP